VDEAKTYAGFGIPGPEPCPSWCSVSHAGQVGMDYIPVDATDRDMAGLATIARLISPDVDDRVRQIGLLLKETHDTRQAGPDDAR